MAAAYRTLVQDVFEDSLPEGASLSIGSEEEKEAGSMPSPASTTNKEYASRFSKGAEEAELVARSKARKLVEEETLHQVQPKSEVLPPLLSPKDQDGSG